jgi:hypothetical protein
LTGIAARDALVAALAMAFVAISGAFRLFAYRRRLQLSAEDIQARHPRSKTFYIQASTMMLIVTLGLVVLVLWFAGRVADG